MSVSVTLLTQRACVMMYMSSSICETMVAWSLQVQAWYGSSAKLMPGLYVPYDGCLRPIEFSRRHSRSTRQLCQIIEHLLSPPFWRGRPRSKIVMWLDLQPTFASYMAMESSQEVSWRSFLELNAVFVCSHMYISFSPHCVSSDKKLSSTICFVGL